MLVSPFSAINTFDASFGIVPIGTYQAWDKTLVSGTTASVLPSNFLECNGQTVNDSESPLNGKVIPDINGQNRFLRGSSVAGGSGGSATHTLTIAEMPSHSHSISPSNRFVRTAGTDLDAPSVVPTAWSESTVTIGNTGGGSAHNNEPQYFNVVWIVRIK